MINYIVLFFFILLQIIVFIISFIMSLFILLIIMLVSLFFDIQFAKIAFKTFISQVKIQFYNNVEYTVNKYHNIKVKREYDKQKKIFKLLRKISKK